MIDVLTLGEAIIDFTHMGFSKEGLPYYLSNQGGAPANVAVAVSRLGGKSVFIGKLSDDEFGRSILNQLEAESVDIRGVVLSKEYLTGLAFTHLDIHGDRSFSFYRKLCADIMLEPDEINKSLIDQSKVFHFGTVAMIANPQRDSLFSALEYTSKKGLVISYDPNLRYNLWNNLETAYEFALKGLGLCDILKISDSELEFLTGKKDIESGLDFIKKYKIPLVFVTCGPKGAYYCYKDFGGYLKTFDTNVVDTTGAGDAFIGGILYKLKNCNKEQIRNGNLDIGYLKKSIVFANAVGSLCASKKGAMHSMPKLEEVEECITNISLKD